MKRRAVWVTIAAVGLLAPGALAQAGKEPGQHPMKQQPAHNQPPTGVDQGASPIAETASFEEGDWRALTTEPYEDIDRGRSELTKKQYPAASRELRRAAVWLKLTAGHFGTQAKGELSRAAQVLDDLSDGVMPGAQQRSSKDVDEELAFVEYQLARFHANQAAARWSSRDNDGAGLFLKMASLEADAGLKLSGKKPDAAGKKVLKNAEDTGNELLKGGSLAPDKVDKALDEVKGEIDKLASAVQPIADKQTAANINPTLDARDWMAVHGEVAEELKAAKSDFAKNAHMDAVQDMLVAAAVLELEGNRAGDKAKAAAADTANELEQQARNVKDGNVKRAGDLDATFAKTQLALAFAHGDLAKKLWGERKTMEVGAELDAAAEALDQAIGYKTIDTPATTKKVIGDTKKLAASLMRGSGFDAAEVEKRIEAFRAELSKVGAAPTKPAKPAPKPRRQAQR